MTKTKVYCLDCRYRMWLTTHESGRGDGDWVCKKVCYDGQNYVKVSYINKTGDCPHYKRKWKNI